MHALRAFATACSAVLQGGAPTALYSWVGDAQDWSETVTHSQGVATGPRVDLLDGELERIRRYAATGDIEPPARVLEYLARRGRGPPA